MLDCTSSRVYCKDSKVANKKGYMSNSLYAPYIIPLEFGQVFLIKGKANRLQQKQTKTNFTMKRSLLILLMGILFVSCSSDNESQEENKFKIFS